MANQRMFIRCKACGAEKFLAKRLMQAYHTISQTMSTDAWDDWFQTHEWGLCHKEGDPEVYDLGLDVFELSYEHHIEGQHNVSDGGA